ncbi:MAG: hypothetical protein ACJAQT_002803 [Akkermansiaceae bacterium]|jgi:hypothetical protein
MKSKFGDQREEKIERKTDFQGRKTRKVALVRRKGWVRKGILRTKSRFKAQTAYEAVSNPGKLPQRALAWGASMIRWVHALSHPSRPSLHVSGAL